MFHFLLSCSLYQKKDHVKRQLDAIFHRTVKLFKHPETIYKGKGIVIVVPVLNCSTKHHAMKTYWEVEVYLHALTSALDGGEWLASRPGRFTLLKSL
jgi:hypothetical protein